MKELTLEDILVQPDELVRFPAFILGAMARRGIGTVEVDLTKAVKASTDELIPWVFHDKITGSEESIAEIRAVNLRPILARFGFFCEMNPYAGQNFLVIPWPLDGSIVIHRFSVFMCNEPTMGFWIRIYLYAIDGIYPVYAKPAD